MQIDTIKSLAEKNFAAYKAELINNQKNIIQDQKEQAIFISLLSPRELEKKINAVFSDDRDLPLKGVPFAAKDNIDVKGLPTTAGCPDYQYLPEESAFAIQQLEAAGAICVGKTNLDQFATGLNGTRSPYGTAVNFYNKDLIPGGSSSGSASSVAWGYTCFALGTDTAGSGRIPAAFQNLTGLKPSVGIFSARGVVPACKSLDCITVFTHTAEEAGQVLNVMAEFDAQDPYGRGYIPLETGSNGKIAVPLKENLEFFGDGDYKAAYESFIQSMRDGGFSVFEEDFSPLFKAAELLYGGPWVAERYHAVGDFIESHPDSVLETTKTIIMSGKTPLASQYFDAEYKLRAFNREFEKLKKEYDIFLTPTAGTTYTKEEMEKDPIQLNTNLGYYTNFMNLLDCSALALPVSFTDGHLPFGVTVFAPAMCENRLLDLAVKFEIKGLLTYSGSKTDSWIPLAVCGAHKRSGSLNYQMQEAGAVYDSTVSTAEKYRFYALENLSPVRPGLVRDEKNGGAVEVEVWNFPAGKLGSFIESIPEPLSFGKLELKDGSKVTSFLCESYALEEAKDITELVRWEEYIAGV